ncbi:MAG: ABC transporter ATP-binding protein [Pseudomonadales bacterium]
MYFNAKLWSLTVSIRRRIAVAVAMGLTGSVLGVCRLLLLGWLIAELVEGREGGQVAWVALSFAAVLLLHGFCEYRRKLYAHASAAQVQREIRLALFDKIQRLGPEQMSQQHSGELVTTSVEGVEQLEIYFGSYLPQLFVALLTPVVIFAIASQIDFAVASVLLIAALFTLFAPSLFQRWDSENSLRRSRAYRAFAAEFLDALQGIVTLKAFGQVKVREHALAKKAHHLFQTTLWVMATNSLTRGITDIGITLGAASALAMAAYQLQQQAISYSALLLVLLLGVEVFRPLRELRALLHDGMLANACADQVFGVLELTDAVDSLEAKARPQGNGIVFENITFSYPGREEQVHSGLDFALPSGKTIGVVGGSGGGKSTIIKLLLRHYSPQNGVIRIGGIDIAQFSLQQLRAQFAVVSQDTYLFHASVRENLLLANPSASEETLRQALRAANAEGFVNQLEAGLDTLIGERGARLSGGQRQRLAIARALLRDAPILILDEALSAVDTQNEAQIQSALNRLMRGRTCLVLAHRLSSVINCDEILLLEGGRVAERGTHAQLVARQGRYATLMASQLERPVDSVEHIVVESTPEVADRVPEFAAAREHSATDILVGDKHSWPQALKQLFSLAAPWKWQLSLTFLLGVARVSSFIAVSVLAAMAAATLKQGGDHLYWLTWLVICAVAAAVLHWLESWLAHDMAFRMLAQMRIALFKQLGRLAPAFMLRRRSGDMINLATHDIEMIEYFFAHTITPVLVAVLVPGAVLWMLTLFSPLLALTLLPFLLLVALLPMFYRRAMDVAALSARTGLAELAAHSVDSIQGLNEVLNFNASCARRAQLSDLMSRQSTQRMQFFKLATQQAVLIELTTLVCGFTLVLVASVLASEGVLSALYLPLIALAGMAAFLPVVEVSDVARKLADTLAATSRLMQVQQAQPSVRDSGALRLDREVLAERGCTVDFKQVAFHYAEQLPAALSGVDLRIEAGQKVALVGSSGAGKSTLAHLLMRYWDPRGGTIEIAGRDIRQISLEELHSQVAIVAQDTYLFNDTLRGNLQIAKPSASDDEIKRALERAQLAEFVTRLPQGLETQVGERGHALSGGQRQRLSIARAFLRDAPILILDEATSHLDSISEQAVQRALSTLMRGRTSLVIAHRLSTVRDADQIVVMGEGSVLECGTHQALLALGGEYCKLLSYQRSVA